MGWSCTEFWGILVWCRGAQLSLQPASEVEHSVHSFEQYMYVTLPYALRLRSVIASFKSGRQLFVRLRLLERDVPISGERETKLIGASHNRTWLNVGRPTHYIFSSLIWLELCTYSIITRAKVEARARARVRVKAQVTVYLKAKVRIIPRY